MADEQIHTGGGAHVSGDANAGRDLIGRDRRSDRSPTQNVYATDNGLLLWLGDIKDDLTEIRGEIRQRLSGIEAELRTQDRHLAKLTGDVSELKELRHGVNEIRHRVEQLMQMEPELRRDFAEQLSEVRQNLTFHINLMWIVIGVLMVGLAWALFIK